MIQGSNSGQGQEIFLFTKTSRLALGAPEPSIYLLVLGTSSLVVNQPWHEAGH